MSDGLVTPETVSKDMLKSMFDAAFMEASFDEFGDLMIVDGGVQSFVFISPDSRGIKVMALFEAAPTAQRVDLLEFANHINEVYPIVRTTLSPDSRAISFEHFICLPGGVPQMTIVQAARLFVRVTRDAVSKHGNELIA